MKAFTFLLFSLLSAPAVFAQVDDDVYFSPKDEVAVEEAAPPVQQPAENYEYDDETDGYYDENYYPESETLADGQGNTYITNNYYGDYYENDYDYTTRLHRYYDPYWGFGYYSPCYTGYYDPWYGGGWSVSIGFGWGYPYYGGGYWGGWYPYYGWGYPYYGGGYWGGGYPYYGWGYNDYWYGYNHGYWNGYYDGYYGGGYGDYYGGGYYYGPRREGSGYSSYRNAEKKTEQMGVAPGQQADKFPVGENKDVIQPVRTDNVQPGKDAIKGNEIQPVRGNEPKPGGQYEQIDKGNVQPSRGNEPKPNTDYNQIDKGKVQPNQPSRSNEIDKAPVDNAPVAPRPDNTNKPNVERQTEHNKGANYNKPQRGNVEPKQPTKGNDRYTQPQQKGNAPSPKLPERYAPKGNNKPSYNAPKTHERGGYNAPSPSPAPSNQKSPGGTIQRAPSGKGGGMQPR